MERRSWAEPYRIKMVEPVRTTSQAIREQAMIEAGFNTFLLRSVDVMIDLLTDSGTGAMSDRQWSAMLMGDEAYAGSRSFYRFEAAVREHYGFRHVIPTHQGRAAEHILSRMCIRPGQVVPGNMYFTTTRLHQELAGGCFIDVIVDEAHDASSTCPFKGNVDLVKLARVIEEHGAGNVAYLSLETNVNMAGGQPCSMENIAAACAMCHRHGIPVYLDATRAAENAYFIQRLEPGFANVPLHEILLQICAHADGCTVSAKKDCFANIGGFLALNDGALADEARNLCTVYEGLHTYGGMTGRDMEAIAVGISESVDADTIRARVGQVEYLGRKLAAAGVPLVLPIGGHGVFLDAAAFLPHMRRQEYPAQALAAALYVDSGVRAMERGAVSAGRDHATGAELFPALELVRLTIPHRVYTQAHLDVAAESVIALHEERQRIVGLRMVYEPRHLRFFQARFEPVEGSRILRSGARVDQGRDTDGRVPAEAMRGAWI